MVNLQVASTFSYSGGTYSGTTTEGLVPFVSNSTSCTDIQTALNSLDSPTTYPVDCDFVSLSNSGVVFFEDPILMTVTKAFSVYTPPGNSWLSDATLTDIYGIETGFVVVVILVSGLIRQFRKISPKLFG